MQYTCALFIVLTLVFCVSSRAQVPIRTIAYTGQQAPGTSATFNQFFSPTMSSLGSYAGTGTVQFVAGLSGPGVNDTNQLGIWLYEEQYPLTGFGLVARRSDPAPGLPVGTFFRQLGFEYPVIWPHHNIVSNNWSVFFAVLTGGINRRSVWVGTRGRSPQVVAFDGGSKEQYTVGPIYTPIRNNDAAPAVSAITFSSAIYTSTYHTDSTALWAMQKVADTAGNVHGRIVFHSRQQIPGLASGFLFGIPETHVLSDDGSIVFISSIRINSGALYGYGIWRERYASAIEEVLVALNGVPVLLPGLNAGESISQFEYLLSNATGSVAFTALISGSPGGYGFWAQDTGSWRMVWRRGMQAPGLPGGVTFFSLAEASNTPRCVFITDTEVPIFMAKLQGTGVTTANDMSVWMLSSFSGLQLLAREGDQMAGAGIGVVFDRINRIAANRYGEIVVEASIRGPGIDSTNDVGLWALNYSRLYVPVVQKGNRFEVEPGVMRTVNQATLAVGDPDYYSTGADGRSTVFNRLRQIAFHASFLDNTIGVNAVCMANLQSVFTDVQESSSRPPGFFTLHQNYPNPFNPSTTIRFALPKRGHVELKVYNTLGQELATLVNEEKNAGTYSAQWNAGSVASGVYFYSLASQEFHATGKMLLLK